MTTLNKISKGGDAYGKVPKRIVVARSLLLFIARSRRRRGNLKGFAEGKRTVPGPGINAIVFRHCEELRFLVSLGTSSAISKRAAWNEAGLKIRFTGKNMFPMTRARRVDTG
jgi:hypothetical protein